METVVKKKAGRKTKAQREAMDERIDKYVEVYGISIKEAEEMIDYDDNYCDSDEKASWFFKHRLNMGDKQVEKFFPPKAAAKTNAKGIKINNAAILKAAQNARLQYLVDNLTNSYGFLFPVRPTMTDCEATFTLEDGTSFTIKIAKHKVQKVVSKEVRRKMNKDSGGNIIPTFPTDAEIRAMAIVNVARGNEEMFPALSPAGSQIGYAIGDGAYPFGSIKITHHKVK